MNLAENMTSDEDQSDETEDQITENSGRISRRSILNASGATTFGVFGLGGRSIKVLDNSPGDDTEKIVYAWRGDEIAETREVPRAWLQDSRAARKAADQLKSQYLVKRGVHSIGIGTSEESIDGLKKKAILVRVDEEAADVDLPESAEGVPVRTIESEIETKWFSNCYGSDYGPLVGGIEGNSSNYEGALTARIEKNGIEYILSVRHLWTDTNSGCDSVDTRGRIAEQNRDYVGTVEEEWPEYDAVFIDFDELNSSRSDLKSEVVDQSGQFCGYLGQDAYDYMMSDSATLKGRAPESCQLTAEVESYSNDFCCSSVTICFHDLVYTDATNIVGGDSGGVFYQDSSGELYFSHPISGIQSEGGTDYQFGAAGYAIHDTLGATFDSGSCW